jgi:outer membrane protein
MKTRTHILERAGHPYRPNPVSPWSMLALVAIVLAAPLPSVQAQNGGAGAAANSAATGSGSSSTSIGSGATGSLPLTSTADQAVFDLAQTVVAGLASSSDLQNAARNVEIDRKEADRQAAAGRPQVSADASATRYDQATSINFGGTTIQTLPTHSEQLSLSLSEQLDITGQIRAATDQQRLQSLADQFQYEYIRNQRILRAKTIYFDLLRAQHLVQVNEASLTTAQRQLLDAQHLNTAQVGEKIDVYRAATQVANAQQQLTSAQNDLDIARANFNDLTGRPLPQPVTVVDVPGVNVGVDIPNAPTVGAPTSLGFTPFNVAPSEIAGIDLNESLKTAFLHRPEVLSDQVNVRVEETGVKLARAGLEPTLDIGAEGLYYPTLSFQNPRKRVAQVTATLRIPLYDGGATRDKVAEARLRTQNAQTTLASAKSNVALDVRQSYLNLQTAARQIASVNTALEQAIAARQLAQIRYEGQVGTYLDVTDAQSALVQAEDNQVDAVYSYLTSRAQFENAIGVPQTR